MKEFKYVITDKEGIHARPAGELIKVVNNFDQFTGWMKMLHVKQSANS